MPTIGYQVHLSFDFPSPTPSHHDRKVFERMFADLIFRYKDFIEDYNYLLSAPAPYIQIYFDEYEPAEAAELELTKLIKNHHGKIRSVEDKPIRKRKIQNPFSLGK